MFGKDLGQLDVFLFLFSTIFPSGHFFQRELSARQKQTNTFPKLLLPHGVFFWGGWRGEGMFEKKNPPCYGTCVAK